MCKPYTKVCFGRRVAELVKVRYIQLVSADTDTLLRISVMVVGGATLALTAAFLLQLL
jgi:hypothetical protein